MQATSLEERGPVTAQTTATSHLSRTEFPTILERVV